MSARPILVTGARGTLGHAFVRLCDVRGLAHHASVRHELDIADPGSVTAALDRHRPWAVVNAAGFVRVDDAEQARERCHRENSEGAALLARACAQTGVRFLTFSSDLVFDGGKRAPYEETDRPAPLSVYGRSKAAAETRVLEEYPEALVVRTSAFFGPWDEHNFVTTTLARLVAGEQVLAAEHAVISPTYVPDLVHVCLDLLIDGASGVWHLANPGAISWAELARQAARLARLDAERVQGRPAAGLGWTAERPMYSVLGSARGALLPPLDDALARYTSACAERIPALGGNRG